MKSIYIIFFLSFFSMRLFAQLDHNNEKMIKEAIDNLGHYIESQKDYNDALAQKKKEQEIQKQKMEMEAKRQELLSSMEKLTPNNASLYSNRKEEFLAEEKSRNDFNEKQRLDREMEKLKAERNALLKSIEDRKKNPPPTGDGDGVGGKKN